MLGPHQVHLCDGRMGRAPAHAAVGIGAGTACMVQQVEGNLKQAHNMKQPETSQWCKRLSLAGGSRGCPAQPASPCNPETLSRTSASIFRRRKRCLESPLGLQNRIFGQLPSAEGADEPHSQLRSSALLGLPCPPGDLAAGGHHKASSQAACT